MGIVNQCFKIFIVLMALSLCTHLKAQLYNSDDFYRQAVRAADAAEANAQATAALAYEQKRANAIQEEQRNAQLYLEAKRQWSAPVFRTRCYERLGCVVGV
jgi:hypothetical protein